MDIYSFFKELYKKGSIDLVKKDHPELTDGEIKKYFYEVFKLLDSSYELFVDGASSSNPGPAGIGVVLKKGDKILKTISKSIGIATNNVAEYTALIEGLKLALSMGIKSISIYSDSQLVVNQLNGAYTVKDEKLLKLYKKALEILKSFENVSINYVGRSQNSLADKLAKAASKGLA